MTEVAERLVQAVPLYFNLVATLEDVDDTTPDNTPHLSPIVFARHGRPH